MNKFQWIQQLQDTDIFSCNAALSVKVSFVIAMLEHLINFSKFFYAKKAVSERNIFKILWPALLK